MLFLLPLQIARIFIALIVSYLEHLGNPYHYLVDVLYKLVEMQLSQKILLLARYRILG